MKKTIPVTLKIEKVHKHKSRFDFEEVAESLFGEMRDTTPEESKALSDYISSISEPTGVNIFDLVKRKRNKAVAWSEKAKFL